MSHYSVEITAHMFSSKTDFYWPIAREIFEDIKLILLGIIKLEMHQTTNTKTSSNSLSNMFRKQTAVKVMLWFLFFSRTAERVCVCVCVEWVTVCLSCFCPRVMSSLTCLLWLKHTELGSSSNMWTFNSFNSLCVDYNS